MIVESRAGGGRPRRRRRGGCQGVRGAGRGCRGGGAAGRHGAARAWGVSGRVMVGPNCMGVFVPDGPSAWIGDLPPRPRPVMSPSSASRARSQTRSLARWPDRAAVVVSSGGEAVTDAADFLGSSRTTTGRAPSASSSRRCAGPPPSPEALAACSAAGKLVVCLKVGRSEAAARAALSHTGALVGSVRAFGALLRRHGAIEVDDFHELVETLEMSGAAVAPWYAYRRGHRVGWRVRGARRPGGGGGRPVRAAPGASRPHCRGASPTTRPRKPARRVGDGGERRSTHGRWG